MSNTVTLTRDEYYELCKDVIDMFLEYRDGYVTDNHLAEGEDLEQAAKRLCFKDVGMWFDVIGSNKGER